MSSGIFVYSRVVYRLNVSKINAAHRNDYEEMGIGSLGDPIPHFNRPITSRRAHASGGGTITPISAARDFFQYHLHLARQTTPQPASEVL
jgi:hypothetical protein